MFPDLTYLVTLFLSLKKPAVNRDALYYPMLQLYTMQKDKHVWLGVLMCVCISRKTLV